MIDLNNNEAEETVVASMVLNNNIIPNVRKLLNEGDFYSKPCKNIYNTVLELDDKNKPIDIITVCELLSFNDLLEETGGREYINDITMGVITTVNYEQHCKIIKNYSKKRFILNMCDGISRQLVDGLDIEEAISSLKLSLDHLSNDVFKDDLIHITQGVSGVVDQLCETINSKHRMLGLPTPFSKVNLALSGLVKGRLYILGARPSQGKSAMAMQIAEHISKESPVVFVSLEMSTEEYTQRSLFSKSNINQDMISSGAINEDTINSLWSKALELEKMNLFIIDKPSCTLKDIESGIINCINKHGSCGALFVDYLQLMGSDNKRLSDDYKVVTANSKGLKQLARKYNIPIVALCQLSRNLESRENKRPILSDLRDSGSIEQDADVVMFLYRDEFYNPQDLVNKGKAELIIRKNRQGALRTIDLLFHASKTEFKEQGIYNYANK